MADVDARPADEAGDGRDVQEPVEHDAAVLGQVHVREQADSGRGGNGHVGGAELVGPCHELRRAPLVGERDKDTGARVHVGVGGGENSSQEHGVDDVGKDLDAGQVGGDDQGGRRSVLGVEQKRRVVGRDEEADEEDGGHEQAEDAPEGPTDGAGHALLGVLGLAGADADQLGPLEAEAGRDQDGPEANELADRAVDNGRVEGARMAMLRESFQYWMMTPAAVSSRAKVMDQLNQYIQPMAKPRVGSMKREAYEVKAPGTGM
ncbi:hypothetical protein Ct61P_13827 [Colletotrichum tofieldiae]|nr:hypothetical protein Ct61P_13827 [Colletotrichum tofieldiae]